MSAASSTSAPGGRFAGGPVPGPTDDLSQLPPPPRRMRWFYRQANKPFMPLAVAGLAASACVYSLINDPNTSSAYPGCTFNRMTGLDCPGCGLTRGVHALITGHPGAALDHNVLLLLVVPVALYAYLQWATSIWFGWELPRLRFPRFAAPILGVLVLTFWVVRNLRWGPFTWLAAGASA